MWSTVVTSAPPHFTYIGQVSFEGKWYDNYYVCVFPSLSPRFVQCSLTMWTISKWEFTNELLCVWRCTAILDRIDFFFNFSSFGFSRAGHTHKRFTIRNSSLLSFLILKTFLLIFMLQFVRRIFRSKTSRQQFISEQNCAGFRKMGSVNLIEIGFDWILRMREFRAKESIFDLQFVSGKRGSPGKMSVNRENSWNSKMGRLGSFFVCLGHILIAKTPYTHRVPRDGIEKNRSALLLIYMDCSCAIWYRYGYIYIWNKN